MKTNHIYHKLCEDMSDLTDESVDLIVAIPPYLNLRQYAIWPTYEDHLFRVLVPGGWNCWNIQECIIDLSYRCMRLCSFYDDVVLDPFMGFGTTVMDALRCGRRYVRYESHEETIKQAKARLREDADIFGAVEDW